MSSRELLCIAVTAVFSALASAQSQPPPVVIAIDAARSLQHIDGFGSSMVVGFEALERGAFDQVVPAGVAYRTTPGQRQALLEMGIRELGATHLRLWLGARG